MIDQKFVDMLRSPIDGKPLEIAGNDCVQAVNQAIQRGEIRDRLDQCVSEPIEGGLVTQQGRWLFPIRVGIPSLVVEEAIQIETLDA